MLGIGYYSIVHVEKMQETGLIAATICTTIGTYFIFGSLLPLFVTMLKKNKKEMRQGLIVLHLLSYAFVLTAYREY